MLGVKLVETLKITFEKNTGKDETTYKTAFFNCKTKTNTNLNDIARAVEKSQAEITQRIGQWISDGSSWVIPPHPG